MRIFLAILFALAVHVGAKASADDTVCPYEYCFSDDEQLGPHWWLARFCPDESSVLEIFPTKNEANTGDCASPNEHCRVFRFVKDKKEVNHPKPKKKPSNVKKIKKGAVEHDPVLTRVLKFKAKGGSVIHVRLSLFEFNDAKTAGIATSGWELSDVPAKVDYDFTTADKEKWVKQTGAHRYHITLGGIKFIALTETE